VLEGGKDKQAPYVNDDKLIRGAGVCANEATRRIDDEDRDDDRNGHATATTTTATVTRLRPPRDDNDGDGEEDATAH
jgi:hypothetical protein